MCTSRPHRDDQQHQGYHAVQGIGSSTRVTTWTGGTEEQLSIPVDVDLLGGAVCSGFGRGLGCLGAARGVGALDELAVAELRSGADERDQVRGVDTAPAGLRGLDELERHGQPGRA